MGRLSKFQAGFPSIIPADEGFKVKPRRAAPHEFVLDAIASVSPWTRPMFGCLAVYVEDKIVLVLRDKKEHAAGNGVWLATTQEHHESLRREFPNMRSIQILRSSVTGWQVLPVDSPNFEETALRACELILARDSRIGKVPGKKSGSRRTADKSEIRSKRGKKSKSVARRRSRK